MKDNAELDKVIEELRADLLAVKESSNRLSDDANLLHTGFIAEKDKVIEELRAALRRATDLLHTDTIAEKNKEIDDLTQKLDTAESRIKDLKIQLTQATTDLTEAGWAIMDTHSSSATCRPHRKALCIVEGDELNNEAIGVGNGSRIFPFQDTGVTVHGSTSHSCTHGAGRVVVASPSEVYDVSVCDTVDGSLDVLFTHDRIHLVRVNINNPLYIFSGIIVVLLIVFVTQNLAMDVMTDEVCKTATSSDICMALSLILAFCTCMLPGFITDMVHMNPETIE
ncbi:hypothetical protein T484DRAFT_1754662 [Baffinella frigidus]|nr:hypothetical protein T484DRAFT_1754662 [Cryptophyta sp. CCMP2293]